MPTMSNFFQNTNMLLILIGFVQLAWFVSITLANKSGYERSVVEARYGEFTQEKYDNLTEKEKTEAKEFCPYICYEVYDEKEVKRLEEAYEKGDNSTLEKIKKEKKGVYSCESTADPAEKRYKEWIATLPDFIKNSSLYINLTKYNKEEKLKKCKEGREIVCGSCVKYMHIRNPLAIRLIILLILLIIGGIAVGVMFAMKVGPFKKRKANVYNPNAQQEVNPQASNQYYSNEYSNANQNNGPGPEQPSQSPTQNLAPQ